MTRSRLNLRVIRVVALLAAGAASAPTTEAAVGGQDVWAAQCPKLVN